MSDSRLPGSRLLALTEEELQRIVLDVHDGPVQYLFAALSQLTALRARLEADGAPRSYAAPLARAVESLEAALGDIRRTVTTFRTPDLAERGLAGVVEELVVGHEARAGSSVELTMKPEMPAVSLVALQNNTNVSRAPSRGEMMADAEVDHTLTGTVRPTPS